MYESLDAAIDTVSALVAVGGLILVLNGAKRRFPLSPIGYSLIVTGFAALLVGILFEASEHLLGDADVVDAFEVIGHALVAGAVLAFAVGFLRWIPSAEKLSQEVTRRRVREDQLEHLALHDQLTGLANRARFHEQLVSAIQRADRHKTMLGVLAIDLDRFKEINERFGHSMGDALLRDAANRLRRGVRSGDLIARLGSDEFIFLATEVESPEQVALIAQRLLDVLDLPDGVSGIAVNGSIGIALYPQHGKAPDELMKHADFALYQAKAIGRGKYHFFDSAAEHDMRVQQRRLEELRKAVAQDELVLFYQPQLDAATGALEGVEALVRWNHPKEGLLSPAAFIPLAEEARVVPSIDAWVLRRACSDALRWQAQGLELRVAVNVSAQSIAPELPATVAAMLRETGLAPGALELEITETSLLSAGESTATKVVHELAALGVQISIDDFGTGYGSLVYLRSLPVDAIKIDRQFIQAGPKTPQDAAIVRRLLDLGHDLGLRVIAEGIETGEQLEFVRRLGCKSAQGYWFSRPLPAQELAKYIQARSALGSSSQVHAPLPAEPRERNIAEHWLVEA